MNIQGKYQLKGSVYPAIKILISGRELDELGNPKYPDPPYTSDAGLNYYLAIPGKQIEKIELLEYDPSDYGQESGGYLSFLKFTSFGFHPKDWELDIAIPKWNAYIDDSVDPPYTYLTNLIGYIYTHSKGRKGGDFGEFKAVDDSVVLNPYATMKPIGKGQFVGNGILITVGAENNTNSGNKPLYFWSQQTGLLTELFPDNQNISSASGGFINTDTKGFKFQSSVISGEIFSSDYFNPSVGVPKDYWISDSITISGENYSLSASSDASSDYSVNVSYSNIDAINLLRNNDYVFIFKDSLSFSTLGNFAASGLGYNNDYYDYTRVGTIYKANIHTGTQEEVCQYTTIYNNNPILDFSSGYASTPINASTICTGIDIEVLPLFLEAIRTQNNSTWVGDKIYYVQAISDTTKVLTENYTITVLSFDLSDLSSYAEEVITVEKSEQPSTPILYEGRLNAIQYMP